MPVTVREKFESRSGDDDQVDLVFVVEGTDDDAEARTALKAEAPGTFRGLKRQSPTVEPVGDRLWEGKARYIKPEYVEPETGDSAFTFDTTGGSQHITQSRATVHKYAPSGQTAPDFGGAIGVTHDSVEGVDITVPVFSFSVTRYIDPGDMSATYIANLYALTSKVNAGTFSLDVDGVTMTFQPGECLFLGASGGKRKKDDWEISFRFAASPNATGLTIGTITGVNKKGPPRLPRPHGLTAGGTAKATDHIRATAAASDGTRTSVIALACSPARHRPGSVHQVARVRGTRRLRVQRIRSMDEPTRLAGLLAPARGDRDQIHRAGSEAGTQHRRRSRPDRRRGQVERSAIA